MRAEVAERGASQLEPADRDVACVVAALAPALPAPVLSARFNSLSLRPLIVDEMVGKRSATQR